MSKQDQEAPVGKMDLSTFVNLMANNEKFSNAVTAGIRDEDQAVIGAAFNKAGYAVPGADQMQALLAMKDDLDDLHALVQTFPSSVTVC